MRWKIDLSIGEERKVPREADEESDIVKKDVPSRMSEEDTKKGHSEKRREEEEEEWKGNNRTIQVGVEGDADCRIDGCQVADHACKTRDIKVSYK